MTDIFNEIDEELRRDRVAQIWKNHSAKLIVLAVLLVAAVAGWRYYEYMERRAAEAAGARYEAALQLSREGKNAEAEAAFAAIVDDKSSSYRQLARLRAAAEAGRADAAKGAAAFEAVAADQTVPQDLRQLATLRAAALKIDGGDPKAAVASLETLARDDVPWRNSARELLGLAALKSGDFDGAGRWFDAIVTDPSSPQSLRSRVEVYLALVRSGPVAPAP